MDGKVALVTGGAQGIGRAIVESLLNNGAKVSIADMDGDVGNRTVQELTQLYNKDRVMFVKCDVTSEQQLQDAFEKTKKTFGTLNIVCNNAGILNEQKWKETVDINLTAVIQGTNLGFQYMGTQNGGQGGVVVNTGSIAGLFLSPVCPVYSATKAAVVFFSKDMALSERSRASQVRVNCVCPSFINTRLGNDGLDDDQATQELLDDTTRNRLREVLLPPTAVAECVRRLIEDETLNGAVMMVAQDGRQVEIDLPGGFKDLKTKEPTSK